MNSTRAHPSSAHLRLVSGVVAASLMAWGLVAAPLVHQAAPHRDEPVLYQPRALKLNAKRMPAAPDHQHGAPGQKGDHGAGSLEHGRALLHSAPALPAVHRAARLVATAAGPTPKPPHLAVRPRVEMPQGP